MNSLVGQKIDQSSKVESLIKELVQEVTSINGQIKSVQAPQPEFVDAGKSWVDKTGQFRGRPLHYAYVGTGAGRGPFVELEDGSIKLDLINGIGIHLMGHSHPRVMKAAVRGALSDIVTQGNLQPNREYQQLTEKLVKLASKNSRLKYAWLSTCGTMANENALKISRQKNSPARFVMGFQNAFAGRSTMMAELTDNPAYKMGLPEYNEVLRVPFMINVIPKVVKKH
jgi:acetylornithine/N-succinyldiaminopimelate aminotransferase